MSKQKTKRGFILTGRQAIILASLGFAAFIAVPLAVRRFVLEAFKIPSGSMIPTLMLGDHVFVDKMRYGGGSGAPERGDVIVFKFPENPAQDFVKRAIALPGDTFEALNGRPVIDGWLVPHCHVGVFHYEQRSAELFVEFLGERDYLTIFDADPDERSCAPDGGCGQDGGVCRGGICGQLQGPWKVAKGEVWVMGDNRNNSHDSRSWRGGQGAGVPFDYVKGRVSTVWMSFGGEGQIVWERRGLAVHGPPVLPAAAAGLAPALEKCLRERPPIAQTTPPRR